ncbi:putative histone-lysine N-methyltransferase PRDM6 [Corticium candelabrum]|uniref:putative histone-lysine N-methyltransferase PRDM6 n=1 Tax=Corticium candelabrum TaxID=121492 RepID=UPI002E2593A7|nr:putative histone-lysine N-methyltransferase PRDM6 [Corticium candelabrum]XP_062515943.1 putative histone-lysine N-methyltransferase PRDM6 [Corticium candelabrum]
MEDMASSETSCTIAAGSVSDSVVSAETYLDVHHGGSNGNGSSSDEMEEMFSPSTIMHVLFGKLEIVPIDPQQIDLTRGPMATYFPKEVGLCESSIPGSSYGVFTLQVIPEGTWMGPFQGASVPIWQLTSGSKLEQMWEVYRDGQLYHYIDASQSPSTNWMKFIQSARHSGEQNMVVFQFQTSLFYKTTRDIEPGEELLVWYGEEEYIQCMGIPIGISDEVPTPKVPPTVPGAHTTGDASGTEQSLATTPNGAVTIEGVHLASEVTSTSGANRQGGESNHPDWNLWKCGQCFKSFTQRIMLQMHVCEGKAQLPFHCGHCNKVYSTSNELRSHVLSHTNDRPFKCGFCHRSFAGATTLANHMRTHTGEKPFRCPQCNKGFTQGTQLARHLRMPGECTGQAAGSMPATCVSL